MRQICMISALMNMFFICGIGRAAPLQMDPSEAVAKPRTDSGRGLCGTAVHAKYIGMPPMPPFQTLNEAEKVLYYPRGDMRLSNRPPENKVQRTFAQVNLSLPKIMGYFGFTNRILLPYAFDPQANPLGDNVWIALRLRGYLNITKPGIVTYLLSCAKQCRLLLGTSRKLVIESNPVELEHHIARQVEFKEVGLYPVEILYYQDATDVNAYLEWAHANSAQPEGPGIPKNMIANYSLVPTTDLFSDVSRFSFSCEECPTQMPLPASPCQSNLQKPGSTTCQNGLCTPCQTARYCGATCSPCPLNQVCGVDGCVGCITDESCQGLICQSPEQICVTPGRCTRQEDCQAGFLCDVTQKSCVPQVSCTSDSMCPSGRICDLRRQLCVLKPRSCEQTCFPKQFCDSDGLCKLQGPETLTGGLGCQTLPNSAMGMLGVAFFVLAYGMMFAGRRKPL